MRGAFHPVQRCASSVPVMLGLGPRGHGAARPSPTLSPIPAQSERFGSGRPPAVVMPAGSRCESVSWHAHCSGMARTRVGLGRRKALPWKAAPSCSDTQSIKCS